jgi:DNA mismatch repair protein MSH4
MRLTARILGSRPGVLNLHLATDISNPSQNEGRMTMLYKIKSGPAREKNYGLNLARVMGFPERFIEVAHDVSQTLVDSMEQKKDASESRRLTRQRKLILNLAETLSQLRDSDMDDAVLGSYLRRLQDVFVTRMDGQGLDDETEEKE